MKRFLPFRLVGLLLANTALFGLCEKDKSDD